MRFPRRYIVLALLLVACDHATGPGAGTLIVQIHPPPPDVQPMVTVTGEHGYKRLVGASTTLTDLPAGTYTVATSNAIADGVRFAGTPLRQVLTVASDATTSALEITYAAVTARLTIDVAGLPGEVAGQVIVTGPSFARTVTETTRFDFLEPGGYTMTASDIEVGGNTYRSTPVTLHVTLGPTTTLATAYFRYAAQAGATQH